MPAANLPEIQDGSAVKPPDQQGDTGIKQIPFPARLNPIRR